MRRTDCNVPLSTVATTSTLSFMVFPVTCTSCKVMSKVIKRRAQGDQIILQLAQPHSKEVLNYIRSSEHAQLDENGLI